MLKHPYLMTALLLLPPAALPAVAQMSAGQQEAAEEPAPAPLAPFNQKMFWFNLRLDEYVLRPVATAYDRILPIFSLARCATRYSCVSSSTARRW